MKSHHSFFYFSLIFLVACGEGDNFSAGVSLGGSGTGPLQTGTTPTRPSDDADPEIDMIEQYIIWSNGQIATQCGDVKITMQLLHNQTKQPLNHGEASGVLLPTQTEPNNVSIQVITENLTERPVFEYFTECKSNIKLEDQFGNEYKNTQEFICPNDSLVRKYDPLQTRTYQYNFSVPFAEGQRKIIYKPDFSTEIQIPKEQRLNCNELIYEINIEKY